MAPDGYVSNPEEFARLRASAERIFVWGTCPPDWVFSSQRGTVDFCDYDFAVSAAFEPVLASLVDRFGDETVNVIMSMPDVAELAFPPWYWPAFRISGRSARTSFWNMIEYWAGDNVGSIHLNADQVLVFGSSG